MVQLLNKNILYGNVTANNLVFSTWNKEIIIEDLEKKDTLFVQNTEDLCHVLPRVNKDFIYFKASDNEFRCVNFKTNQLIWKITTSNKVKNFFLLNDSIGILDIKHTGIIGVNYITAKELYRLDYKYNGECSLPDSSPYPIVFDDANFYINDWQCKTIRAFDIENGQEVWGKYLSRGVSKSVLFEDKIFVGVDEFYKGGSIYILDAKNGSVLEKHSTHFEWRRNPVLWKNKIIFYNYDKNSLEEYDFKTSSIDTIKKYYESNGDTGKRSNEITGQMFLANDFIYYQNNQFNIMKLDLNTKKETFVAKSNKGGISAVYVDKSGKELIFY